MAHTRPVAGEKIVRAEWVARAVALAVKGYSYRRIAAKVGKSKTAVANALAEELQDRRPSPDKVEEWRAIQRERIERQLEAWIPRSIKGDKDAANSVVRFMERGAKLDGLDAPAKSETKTTVGFDDLSDEELERRWQEARKRDAGE